MLKNTYNRIALLAMMCFGAVACQTMTEEAPINPTAEAVNELENPGDENARKGNLAEFGAFLTGAEEVPAVNAPGSGSANFKLSADGNSMSYELRVANTTGIIFAHLHQNVIGQNGPVVVTLIMPQPAAGLQNGVIKTGVITKANLSGVLAGAELSSLIDAMKEGKIYVNVHTAANQSGELRGQVSIFNPNYNKNFTVKLSGANEVPNPAITNATGVAKFQVKPDGSGIEFQVNVAGMSDVRFAHIHFGKAGENGLVVADIREDKVLGPVSGVYAKGTFTNRTNFKAQLAGGDLVILEEAFRTGNAYVNVHSDRFPGGELRGNF